ncbi:hypothetical protein AJ80_08003 [Polytolypa hystricis UAMH7299]|uniref:Myb-like domain-containing protein n=1 Tax=Polytolypa hystricis (strain UAMH7299) TaxID=1447883 RepID=A0A2B7XFN6_POLH7|nr:hypothetical protein AJ80_08003 [Polytolypa hystricis UAMH7299]
MLLPSALSCDLRHHPVRARFPGSHLFPATPPPPDEQASAAAAGLRSTCRALQSLLTSSPASSPRFVKPAPNLQSPLHMRSRPLPNSRPGKVVKAAHKAAHKAPRGANKRRREALEEDHYNRSDSNGNSDSDREASFSNVLGDPFTTPKRQRRMPPDIPLGLNTTDFQSLQHPTPTPAVAQSIFSSSTYLAPPIPDTSIFSFFPRHPVESRDETVSPPPQPQQHASIIDPSSSSPSSSYPCNDTTQQQLHGAEWTRDDDQRLIGLVLEKLNLTQQDWDECARQMGKDNDSVGRRWKALVGEGNIGLRRGQKMVRGRILDSWR